MGVNMDYLNENADPAPQPAETDIRYGDPSGNGYRENVAAYGQNEESGFYDQRDDIAGGSDTQWNLGTTNHIAGANWASAGDNAPVFNASSGLGGERTKFGETLSQDSLAGGENTGNFSPV